MEFDLTNIPLIIAGALFVICVGLNIALSLFEGALSKIAIILSVPAHAGMLVCLLISGAPLGYAVLAVLISLLALSLSALIKYELKRARAKRNGEESKK